MENNNKTDYDHFASMFGLCLYKNNDIASFYIGLLSIFCWVLCIVPQFVINCKNGKRSVLSPYLFNFWLFGDILNLTGSILTNQLLFQKISCVFFVTMDVLNIGQYIYFSRKIDIVDDDGDENDEQGLIDVRNNTINFNIDEQGLIDPESRSIGHISPYLRPLTVALLISEVNGLDLDLETCVPLNTETSSSDHIIGLILGSFAGLMYISSRVTQLRKIRRDRSVKGLLLSMFIYAIFGNIFYIIAIFVKNSNILNSIPWIMCASIVLCFDIVISFHFYLL